MPQFAKCFHAPSFILGAAASFRHGGPPQLRDNVRDCRGTGGHRTGARHTAQAAIPPPLALVEIEAGKGDLFPVQIFPNVHFGPIQERMNADGGAGWKSGVELVPQLGRLIAEIPLAMLVAQVGCRRRMGSSVCSGGLDAEKRHLLGSVSHYGHLIRKYSSRERRVGKRALLIQSDSQHSDIFPKVIIG
jgi:hypothetical protein